MWTFVLISQNRSTNQRSAMNLRSPNPNFLHACRCMCVKVFIFKNSRGPKYYYFFVKIGMKLSFTLKNKHRNTNLIFDFLKVPFRTPQKVCFWFLKKTPLKICYSCFGFDSALKTIDAQMFLWSVFFKRTKKSY